MIRDGALQATLGETVHSLMNRSNTVSSARQLPWQFDARHPPINRIAYDHTQVDHRSPATGRPDPLHVQCACRHKDRNFWAVTPVAVSSWIIIPGCLFGGRRVGGLNFRKKPYPLSDSAGATVAEPVPGGDAP